MPLNPKYFVSINLQEYLVDKDTGLPLSGGYIAFYKDRARNQAKIVYELTGSPPNYTYSPLPNPMRIGVNGVPVNNSDKQTHIYYYPYDADGNIELYFVEVFNNLGVSQYTLQGWPNVTAQDSPEVSGGGSTDNQISNGQFSQVIFTPSQGLVINFDSALTQKSYQIAPDWELIISSTGSGSVEINQVALEGALNVPTNAPYYLSFQPTGNKISSLVLRQRLSHNPDIWSTTTDSPGYVAGFMLVNSLDGQPHTIQLQYTQSNGPSAPQTIVSGSTGIAGYVLLSDIVLLNAGSNTDNANIGSIYIDIVLPTIGFYGVSSIQVSGVENDITPVAYQQETVNRQIDHLFHWYKTPLDYKPIKSYLVGWDFPLNPAQYGSSGTLTVASAYAWDQTILYSSVPNSLEYSRFLGGKATGSLHLYANTSNQFAVIQYLTVPEIYDLLKNEVSCNVVMSSTQGNLTGCISLWYTSNDTLPNLNTNFESIVDGLNSFGKPSAFNGTWAEVPRSIYGDAIFETSNSIDINDFQSFGFNSWKVDDATDLSAVKYFAIVVGFSTVNSGNSICLQSCSIVPGSIPTIPAPQTVNEVLDDCEYYFESTYDYGVTPGTITNPSKLLFYAIYNNPDVYLQDFVYVYRKPKVSLPIMTTFSTKTGQAGYMEAHLRNGSGDTVSPVTVLFSDYYDGLDPNAGTKAHQFIMTNANPVIEYGISGQPGRYAFITFHATLDSRLGIYNI